MFFITIYRGKIDQSEEFDVIGQQVSYCRRPRVTCHMDDIMPSGIIITPVQYNYGILHLCWVITNTC